VFLTRRRICLIVSFASISEPPRWFLVFPLCRVNLFFFFFLLLTSVVKISGPSFGESSVIFLFPPHGISQKSLASYSRCQQTPSLAQLLIFPLRISRCFLTINLFQRVVTWHRPRTFILFPYEYFFFVQDHPLLPPFRRHFPNPAPFFFVQGGERGAQSYSRC